MNCKGLRITLLAGAAAWRGQWHEEGLLTLY